MFMNEWINVWGSQQECIRRLMDHLANVIVHLLVMETHKTNENICILVYVLKLRLYSCIRSPVFLVLKLRCPTFQHKLSVWYKHAEPGKPSICCAPQIQSGSVPMAGRLSCKCIHGLISMFQKLWGKFGWCWSLSVQVGSWTCSQEKWKFQTFSWCGLISLSSVSFVLHRCCPKVSTQKYC